MNSPAFNKRIGTPLRSAMKGKNRKRTKLGWTASRLTFVSTPMVREYFGDAPVRWSVDLRENLNVSPSAMQHTELEQELEVREVEEDTNLMTPREKAAKVDTLWREEIESELMSYDFPVSGRPLCLTSLFFWNSCATLCTLMSCLGFLSLPTSHQ